MEDYNYKIINQLQENIAFYELRSIDLNADYDIIRTIVAGSELEQMIEERLAELELKISECKKRISEVLLETAKIYGLLLREKLQPRIRERVEEMNEAPRL